MVQEVKVPFVTLGGGSHDNLSGVSTADHHTQTVAGDLNHQDLANRAATDHHTATVAGDLNLADLAERLHASLTSVGSDDHLTAVSQAEMEAETAVTRSMRSELIRHSPGVAKAWCRIEAAGTLASPSYNIASITDTGTGDRIIVFDTDFSTGTYMPVHSFELDVVGTHGGLISGITLLAGSMVIKVYSGELVLSDQTTQHVVHGDQ